MWDAIVHGILGDKNKGYQDNLPCPYMLCPSHMDHNGKHFPNFHKSRMKFIQKIQPTVYQYRCQYCHCLLNKSLETAVDGRESWRINPVLIGGRASYITSWRR